MPFRKCITVLLIVLLCQLNIPAIAYAGQTEHVLTNPISGSCGYDGSTANYFDASLMPLVPDGMNAITKIYGRYKWTGNAPSVHGSLTLTHGMGLSNNGYQPYGNYSDPIELVYFHTSTHNKDTWYYFTATFDPLQGEGVGLRKIRNFIDGMEHRSFYLYVEILEVRYITYTYEDVHVEITPDRYVSLHATLGTNLPGVYSGWRNLTDGRNVSGTDTLVVAEKTYYYRFYSNLGQQAGTSNYTDYPVFYDVSIKVPSDATYAMEAAQNAEQQAVAAALASQQAFGDVNYIRNNILSCDAGIIQDDAGSVLTAARQAVMSPLVKTRKADS